MTVQFLDVVDVGNNRITSVADPTSGQDAATRAYVLAQIAAVGGLTLEDVRDAIAAMITAGNNIDVTYTDDTTNVGSLEIAVENLTSADLSDFATAVVAAVNAGTIDADTLATFTAANLRDRTTHTGVQSADSLTDGTTNKAFLATERTKLTGIATGATANSADATLLARANHTGTQAIATIAAAATARIFGRNTAGAGAGEELTAAQVKTMLAIATTDVSGFSTAADARVTAVVTAAFINALTGVDADTLNGFTKAQIVTDSIAGVVNSAPSTLDTLNELAAALGNDANFATTITTALAARVQSYAATVGDGSTTTFTITHNLGSRDVTVQIYEAATPYGQVWATIKRATTNTVTVTFSTAPTTNQYRVVCQGRV
jgi:hypothetical protein